MKLQGEGKYMSRRWYDMIKGQKDMDAEEIIRDVVERTGIKVVSHEST